LKKSVSNNSDSISIGNRIFCLGGYSPVVDDVNEISFTGDVIAKAPMLAKKYAHSLCDHLNMIYATGGYNGSTWMKNCERYSVANNSWEKLPDMIVERVFHGSCIHNNQYLYTMYGNN